MGSECGLLLVLVLSGGRFQGFKLICILAFLALF